MRDAEPCDPPAGRERVTPRHAAVWVRVAGAWRVGSVQDWYRLGDQWAVWLQYDDPDGGPWARWGSFVFDRETIRPRNDETRPP